MSDLNLDGMAVAPGVVETIVTMAVADVDGVACVGTPTASGIMSLIGGKPSTQGIDVVVNEEQKLDIAVHIEVKYGYALPKLAEAIRNAVADAIDIQIGAEVGSIDIYVDGIQFTD